MDPETKINGYVLTATVAVMFIGVSVLAGVLAPLQPLYKVAGIAAGILASAGTYRLIAIGLAAVLRSSRWMREWVLGPHYLEGTWVGFFRRAPTGEINLVVEFFRQSLTSLDIQGHAYHANGDKYATWISEASHVDAVRGTLHYVYNSHVLSKNVPQDGLGFFCLIRNGPNDPANRIEGHSADLIDGYRSPSFEIKISPQFVDLREAFKHALEFAQKEGALPVPPGTRKHWEAGLEVSAYGNDDRRALSDSASAVGYDGERRIGVHSGSAANPAPPADG